MAFSFLKTLLCWVAFFPTVYKIYFVLWMLKIFSLYHIVAVRSWQSLVWFSYVYCFGFFELPNLWVYTFIKFGKFQQLFLSIIFLPPLLTLHIYMFLNVFFCSTSYLDPLYFFKNFFSLCFILDIFYCYIFKCTEPFLQCLINI